MSCEGCEEGAYVIDALAKLLAEIAIIVNGPEPPLTRWSYHDLPEKVRALKQAPPAALAVPEGLTPRHWRVIDFALWRFINEAHDRAEAAAQDNDGRYFKPGSYEAFLKDAKDAEFARGIVMDHVAMLAAAERAKGAGNDHA